MRVSADLGADFGGQRGDDAVEFAQCLQDLSAPDLREVAALHRGQRLAVVGHDAQETLLHLFVDLESGKRTAIQRTHRLLHAVEFGLGGDGVRDVGNLTVSVLRVLNENGVADLIRLGASGHLLHCGAVIVEAVAVWVVAHLRPSLQVVGHRLIRGPLAIDHNVWPFCFAHCDTQ